jgi:hypothetical protein
MESAKEKYSKRIDEVVVQRLYYSWMVLVSYKGRPRRRFLHCDRNFTHVRWEVLLVALFTGTSVQRANKTNSP